MQDAIRKVKNLFTNHSIAGSILYHNIHDIFVIFYAYGIDEKRYTEILRILRNLNYSLASQAQRFYKQFSYCLELEKLDYGRADDPFRFLNFIPSLKASFERASKFVIERNKNLRMKKIEVKKRYDELTLVNPNAVQKKVIDQYLSIGGKRDIAKAEVAAAPEIIKGQKAKREILESEIPNFDLETQLKYRTQEQKEIDIKQYPTNAKHSLITSKLRKQREEPDQVNEVSRDVKRGKKSIKSAGNGQSKDPKAEVNSSSKIV